MKDKSGNCVKCGTWRKTLQDDHIVPKWKGGSDDPSNKQRLCANCHEDKTHGEAKERASTVNARLQSEKNMRRYWKKPETKKVRSRTTKQQWKDTPEGTGLKDPKHLERRKLGFTPEVLERMRQITTARWTERRAKGLTGRLGECF